METTEKKRTSRNSHLINYFFLLAIPLCCACAFPPEENTFLRAEKLCRRFEGDISFFFISNQFEIDK